MDISNRASQALITAAVGVVVVVVVRTVLVITYDLYERRIQRRDPSSVARRRTTFTLVRRLLVALMAIGVAWAVLSLYDITSEIAKALLASSAVLAVFVGLAFSTPLSNLGSGLLVAFTQPLRLGDRITIGNETGFVEDIALIYTTLVTDDGRRVFIPNTQLTTSKIINRTIKDPRLPISAHFPVSIETPIGEARQALLASITALPGADASTARVNVGEITDRIVWLEAAAYGPINADIVLIESELRELGLAALRDRGFLAD
ncbi:MAG: mechanosensitive ion channel domain-containing protein [Thermoleophilia bacterium]